MKAGFFASCVVAAGLAGCAAQPGAKAPGPAYEHEMREGRPGIFGDLTWTVDLSERRRSAEQAAAPAAATAATATATEQEEFKKWRESSGQTERQEFEEWRAWQEWKRKNPK
jgi:hypothetical protein